MAPQPPQSPSTADKTGDQGPAIGNGRAAVDEAASSDPKHLHPVTAKSATDWFLNPDEEESIAWATLPINVAPAGRKENIVNFKIQVVDRDEIKRMRKEATIQKPDGMEEIDEMEANLRIAVEGLLDPDIKNDEKLRNVRGEQYMDPGDALRARFAHKPGIIDQIAGKIVQISGYNSADVKEVKAAGN